jgi:hypothetical protein
MSMKRLLSCALLSLSAFSTAQADEITLLDGTKLNGTIRSMDAANVVFAAPFANREIMISRDHIQAINTDRPISIFTKDNRELHGPISSTDPSAVTVGGGAPVPLAQIREITRSPITGNIALGGSLARGNSERQDFSLRGTMYAHAGNNLGILGGEFNYAEQNPTPNIPGSKSKPSANNGRVFGEYDRYFTQKLFGFVRGEYKKNRFQDLDYRLSGFGGLGYQFLDDGISWLRFQAGAGYAIDNFFRAKNRDGAAGSWDLDFRRWLSNSKVMQFYLNNHGEYKFEDLGDILVLTRAGVSIPIVSSIIFNTGIEHDYRTKPAQNPVTLASFKDQDIRYFIGLGYSWY